MSQGSVPLFWRLKKSKYGLIGTKCKTCSQVFFPPKSLCPDCRRRGVLEDFKFSGSGDILSYTIITAPPEGFESYAPYAVGLIKLDEGATISGQVVGDITKLDIGKKVKTVFRKMYEDGDGGVIHYGVKFEVVEGQ